MSHQCTISLDAMGGDHGLSVTVPAAIDVLQRFNETRLILVGDETQISSALDKADINSAIRERITIQHASQTVGMDEPPSSALRNKKDSSMRRAIDLVKKGQADAAVSAGNTGALMATARFVLKTIPGIDRPAIMTAMPNATGGFTKMLDLGANVDCSASHLLQFAIMGSVHVAAVDGNDRARIGLLNVGEEEIKGNDQVKEAAQLLGNTQLNYIGFVEGDDIFKGTADVIVCDGFVGNVALKTSEGLAKMISSIIRESFSANLFSKLAAVIAMPVLKTLKSRFDPRRYNGASLLGLRGIVVKSHGGADVLSYAHAIETAIYEVDENVPEKIGMQVQALLKQDGETA